MKILTFITNIDQSKGGPARSVPMLVRGLALEGIDSTLMLIKSNDMNLHALDNTTAKIHFLPSNYKRCDLERFVKEEHFDLIHGQCIWEPLFHHMRVVADKYHIPFVLTPRGTLEPWSLQQKKWKKRIARWLYQDYDLRRCACIYATAEMEAQHIRELGFKNPVCVIPNGIETDGYPCRKDPSKVRKQILFLSRIHPKKGIEVLIDAFSRLHNEFPKWRIAIVGNGEDDYRQSLINRVKELGLGECISISTPVFGSAKMQLYQESSIFCLPSYSENFGMVIAEALSCGVPAITTNGTPWQLLNGDAPTMGARFDCLGDKKQTGWCIDLSVDNLEKTLREAMMMSPDELYEMGQRGSLLVNTNFNYRSVAKLNKALYDWILRGGDTPQFIYV